VVVLAARLGSCHGMVVLADAGIVIVADTGITIVAFANAIFCLFLLMPFFC